MALPKRRHSHSRTRRRRAHDALTPPNLPNLQKRRSGSHARSRRFVCPQCKQIKLPHRICPNCGHYGSVQVVKVERS
ncbi:MAG: 50S ribosomal protein L32 [Planctomycetes bacterium]|nr:50S ribosomal protein L32 [Planctomycetota bacterium]MBM4080602.1 50S ribosomal protein L32 [Planctomycetota bacterium]MBM4084268.1 50S ribosomal protein L32 [Planctomycetota bacterium]